jgi:hypothetical protein
LTPTTSMKPGLSNKAIELTALRAAARSHRWVTTP